MAYPATVQLSNTLPAVVLSGNKIPLQFQASENFLETEGSKAEVILTWSDFAVADEYFDLLLAGETVRFTCKAAPDNSGIQFHDNSGAGTLNEWVALLASDLQANYLLSRYYDLSVTDAAITITAKENGSDYSQEFTAGAGIDCVATETAIPHLVERIVLNIEQRTAFVQIDFRDRVGVTVEVNLLPILSAATTTQKNVIRSFIKAIIAEAVEVSQATLPEVFA